MVRSKRGPWKPKLEAPYWIRSGDEVRANIAALEQAVASYSDPQGIPLKSRMGRGYSYLERALRGEALAIQDAWFVEATLH